MKTLKLATLFTLCYFSIQAQNIRTFNNLELSTSISKNTHQYALFWGESIQVRTPVPFRFTTGLRFSMNNKTTGIYPVVNGANLSTLSFEKRPRYTTFALPVGLELFYKGLGVGAFQEVISLSGKKSYDSTYTPLAEKETLKSQGFSHVFGKKQNLTGGIYLIYTFSDSFSIKAGYNRITSTFTKANETKELGYARLSDDTFTVGIRLNIEK
ncbi:MAG: hypothetical protein LRY55_10460 [Leadbetterella sp.]|nr:hypothetical protein [Leadbetterella sp.]